MKKRLILLTTVFAFAALIPSVAQEQAPAQPVAQTSTISAVELKQITPFRYAALMMKGSYDQHGTAFGQLYQLAGEQNLGYDLQIFGVYFGDPAQMPVEQLEWLVGFPLSDGQQVKEPLVEKLWDYAQIAQVTYTGPFTEEMNKGPQAVMTWVMSSGYSPVGPMIQKYVGMPSQNEKGEWYGTIEISLPVQKM